MNLSLELDLELRNLREQTDILNGKKSDLNQVPYRDPEFLRYLLQTM